MPLRDLFREYFRFSKRERNGLIVLWALVLISMGVYVYLDHTLQPAFHDTSLVDQHILAYEERLRLAREEALVEDIPVPTATPSSSRFQERRKDPVLVPFDPNTLSQEGWESLGIPRWLAKRIVNYRGAGGSFRVKSDVQRIYGFPEEQYAVLEPFIQLPDTLVRKPRPKKPKPERTPIVVLLNTSTEEDWMALRGIGPSYSRRIVKYRNMLGGFHKPEQLLEVYGMTDSLYTQIAPFVQRDTSEVKQLDINTASAYELSRHPYLTWNMGLIIESHRKEHGPYVSVDQLQTEQLFNDSLYAKIAPYLTVIPPSKKEPSEE